MKHIICLAALGLCLAACNEVTGTVTVNSDLSLNTKNSRVVLPQGNYDGQMSYDSDKREMQIKIKDAAGHDQKIKIQIPAGVAVPTSVGSFAIPSSVSGQPFNLNGNMNTNVVNGPVYQAAESCGVVGAPYPYQRYRIVQYHEQDTDVTVATNFVAPAPIGAQGLLLATFAGERIYAEKVYDYIGPCY